MRALAFASFLLVVSLPMAGCEEGKTTSGDTTGSGGSGASGGNGGTTATSSGSGGGAPTTTSGGAGGTGAAGGSGGAGASGGDTGGSGGTGGSTTTSSSSTTTTTTTTTSAPGSCVWGDDCGAGKYCLAPGCVMGTCVQKPVPVGQSPDADPVCGCDGVTYWNDEIAASDGMSIAATGSCAMVIACGPDMACPGTMKCNRQVAGVAACMSTPQGECWGIALSCPLDGPKARACSNARCELQCSLIQSQNPWYDDPACE